MKRKLLLFLFGISMALDGVDAGHTKAQDLSGTSAEQSYTHGFAFTMPTHRPQADLAFTMPTHRPQVDLAFTMPTHRPQADLAFTMPTHRPQQPTLA